jgi:hypothetical protein
LPTTTASRWPCGPRWAPHSQDVADLAELSLDIVTKAGDHSQDRVMHAAPGHQPEPVLRVRRETQLLSETISGTHDWARYEIAAQVPADAEHMGFELTLIGRGKVRLRDVELIRTS